MYSLKSITLSLTFFILQHLLIQPVHSIPPPSNTAVMSPSASPPRHENIRYPIPSSTITLDIYLNEAKPIGSSNVNACLSGALAEARRQSQSSLVEGLFRYSAPPPADLRFAIIGTIFVNELTWPDIVTILQGLQSFYAERRQ